MPEALHTRTEHSRSIDDAEKYRATQTLTDLGLLIPLSKVESYHGRLREPGQEVAWSVDPSFTNGSNDSGNFNVNARPTLYTGEKQVAIDFAQARGREAAWSKYMSGFQGEVRQYSPKEREAWLARLNKEWKERWDTFDPEYQARNPFEPYESSKLDVQHFISDEARRREAALPAEEKQARWKRATRGYMAEVHEIVSADKDAMVLDLDFGVAELDEAERQRYDRALKALILPITEGSPVSFEARNDLAAFMEAVKDRVVPMYAEEDIPSIAREAGVNERLVRQMCGSFNALQIALMSPGYLARKLIESRAGIVTDKVVIESGAPAQEVPLNLEYAERFFREAHIIGVSQPINSATLGKDVTSLSFFDLEKVNTKERIKAERHATTRKLGAIASQLSSPEVASGEPTLVRLLRNAHVKPRDLVEAMKEIEGYKEIFEADAGNWEGFTLEEHMETVLRNFDENFADDLPVELLAPMRLALLAHDLGKPQAVANGEKHKEKEYNLAEAANFFAKIGLPDKTADFLSSILEEGVELAHKSEIARVESASQAFRDLAGRSLRRLNANTGRRVTERSIEGYISLCNIILVCDGGAYTSMAITSRPGKGRYRNAPSFNSSFAQPVGLGKRGLKLAGPDDITASPDLAPSTEETNRS